MPEDMPEDMPDRMPEDMSEYMPEDMPVRMPDRMPEDMSDRMPQDLSVRKCINVMVGITRSKVIFGFPHYCVPDPLVFPHYSVSLNCLGGGVPPTLISILHYGL